MTEVIIAKNKQIRFWCPGCEMYHIINDTWTWNQDKIRPTITPSILVRGVVPLTDLQVSLAIHGKFEPISLICHSYITDGQIQFLNDSTHKLSGQTVPLKLFYNC